MSDPDPIEHGVRGERDATTVLGARSVQSRVSNVLALGLMSALGLGALTWYYAHTMQRQSHAQAERASRIDAARARGFALASARQDRDSRNPGAGRARRLPVSLRVRMLRSLRLPPGRSQRVCRR